MNDTTPPVEDTEVNHIVHVTTPFGTIEGTSDLGEAIEMGGLDFLVEQIGIRASDHLNVDTPGEDGDLKGYKAVRRADDHDVIFNIPTQGYLIVQNQDVLDFAHPLVEAANGCYVRVGSLERGATIFAFAELPDKVVIRKGEEMTPHLVIRSSHDGSASISISFLVTLPGLNGAVLPYAPSGTKSSLSFRHTKNARLRLSEIERLLTLKNQFFQTLKEDAQRLIGTEMTDEEAEVFVNELLEFPVDLDAVIHPKKQQMRDSLMEAFQKVDQEGVANTRYAMLLAMAYYRTYEAPTRTKTGTASAREEARFSSVLSGTSKEEINTVFARLLKGAAAAEVE